MNFVQSYSILQRTLVLIHFFNTKSDSCIERSRDYMAGSEARETHCPLGYVETQQGALTLISMSASLLWLLSKAALRKPQYLTDTAEASKWSSKYIRLCSHDRADIGGSEIKAHE